jgi:hypothetical protein
MCATDFVLAASFGRDVEVALSVQLLHSIKDMQHERMGGGRSSSFEYQLVVVIVQDGRRLMLLVNDWLPTQA